MTEGNLTLNHGGIYIDFAHVVHDDGDFFAFTIIKNVAQYGGFTSTQEAWEHSNG